MRKTHCSHIAQKMKKSSMENFIFLCSSDKRQLLQSLTSKHFIHILYGSHLSENGSDIANMDQTPFPVVSDDKRI